MSRLIVDVTSEQHQMIKALAAMEGQSIKEYVLARILPAATSDDETAAYETLKHLLERRLERVATHGVSDKSIPEITEETLQRLGKV